MAFLPPKIPNMTPNSPAADFVSQKKISSSSSLPSTAPKPSSVFFNLETPTMTMMMSQQSLLGSSAAPYSSSNYNNGFDEEQFGSMFSDEIDQSNNEDDEPTFSDHNSNEKLDAAANDDQKHYSPTRRLLRHCNNEATNISNHPITDPKRVKRILANRQSARRSRVRKLQYITELERSVTTLQAEVSMLSPRVAFLDQQRLLLNVDNSALKQRIATLSQHNIFKDADEEALQREIERLRQLYHRQQKNQKIMEFNGPSPVVNTSPGDQKQKLLYV